MKQLKIFCDFDGTITETDNIEAIMKHFGNEEGQAIFDDILDKKTSIKQGVENMFLTLPSSKKEEIVQFLRDTAIIRTGFQRFVDYTKEQNIPFYVVSGGIDFFVEPLLSPYGPFNDIYCNSSNFDGDTIQIGFPHACGEICANYETQSCGCCKPTIMQKYVDDNTFSIVIGDSVTDFEAAKHADVIFARDRLQTKCEESSLNYIPFTTFDDCLRALQQLVVEHT